MMKWLMLCLLFVSHAWSSVSDLKQRTKEAITMTLQQMDRMSAGKPKVIKIIDKYIQKNATQKVRNKLIHEYEMTSMGLVNQTIIPLMGKLNQVIGASKDVVDPYPIIGSNVKIIQEKLKEIENSWSKISLKDYTDLPKNFFLFDEYDATCGGLILILQDLEKELSKLKN